MIEFVFCDPDELPFQALIWLQVSVDNTPGGETALSQILERGRQGLGSFHLVKSDKLIGCIYTEWAEEALNVVLLGGEYIKDWRNEMHDFCISLIRARGLKNIFFIGRYGIGKIFPQFKCIGTLFAYRDNGG